MRKFIAICLVLMMVVSLAACASSAPATAAADEEKSAENTVAEASAEASGIMTEEEGAAARDAGTLEADPYAGFDYSPSAGTWYYSNYPNYKDFNEDGVLKVAFVCKYADTWFIPKDRTLKETLEKEGIEYMFIDAAGDEEKWVDGVDTAINQDVDCVVLCPVNTALLPDVVEKLQEAGIAYMTTDDPGQDMYGFYPPNYGLDDYKLYYQLGQAAADKMEKKGFLDDVADGYEDLRVVIMDSPAVEAIHARDEGILDGLRTKYPDIPDEKVIWLDCGGGLGDECAAKVAPCIQANLADTNKWIFASGSGDSIHSTLALIKENGISMEDVMFIEAVAEDSVSQVLREDETESCVFLGLCSAPSGTGIGNMIIDLFKNGTPFPGLTSYEFIEVDHNNIDDFYKNYLEGNL